MAMTSSDEHAQRARRKIEQMMRSIRPTTRTRKVLVILGAPLVGALTEQTVKTIEQRGPELAAKGAKLAKEKLPLAAEGAGVKIGQLRVKIHELRNKAVNGAR
jgi:hypothetical protein